MPVAIVIPPDGVEGMPAIIEQKTDAELFSRLCTFTYAPTEARVSESAMREWLETLPPPSGWYADADEAKAATERIDRERDAKLMRAALGQTGLSQPQMTLALGLSDPSRLGSPVRKVLSAKSQMSGPTRRALAYVLKYGPLSDDEIDEIFNSVQGGRWQQVKRSEIRRS